MSDLGSFSALEISATGLTAQRLRMNVVANNIANASTTRTPEGGPYKRQVVSFQAALNGPVIALPANDPASPHLSLSTRSPGQHALSVASERIQVLPAGVEVGQVTDDPSEPQMIYDPSHPDADEKGYVKMPNINPVVEMMDLMGASRAYEANITAMGASKDMVTKTLEIGR
jgi:flagellar basal-body rod protein FlgC